MGGKKGVLIVDEHPLFREGVKTAISRNGKFEVLGETGRAFEALHLAVDLKPDVVLIGVALPNRNGIELTKAIKRYVPDTALLVVSVNSSPRSIADSFEAGAAGYLSKDSSPEILLHALEIVSQGGYFLDGPIAGETLDQLKGSKVAGSQNGISRYESLTRRQKQVAHLLVRGLSYKAIGEKLCISPRTVEGHRNEIMKNLDLLNTVELTRYVFGLGLIEPDGDDT